MVQSASDGCRFEENRWRVCAAERSPGRPFIQRMQHPANGSTWNARQSGFVTAWHALGFVVVLVLPALSWTGRLPWTMTPAEQLQVWIWGAVYLLYVSTLRMSAGRGAFAGGAGALLAAAACWGGGYVVLSQLPGATLSRGIALLAAGSGITLGRAPFFLAQTRAMAVGLLLVVSVAALVPVGRGSTSATPRVESFGASSALHLLSIGVHPDIAPRRMDGGALIAVGDGFLLGTAHGTFHSVAWTEDGRLRSTALSIPSPLNRDAFMADLVDSEARPFFRLTGMALDSASTVPRLYVAHQYWNSGGKCLTMRVSAATLDLSAGSASPWEPVYETSPCLPMSGGFTHNETGGRLAWREGKLLLSVGDHGFALKRGLAQDSTADYGKILELDLKGGRTIFSRGHRNPQGLVVTSDGSVWSTEHGPQGGDELNIVVRGGNYGWPVKTYGTQYGLRFWPVENATQNHAGFIEPAYAFVPAVGPSAALEVAAGPLEEWRGDLLVASLVARSVFRFRIRDSRVIYAERIDVRHRVRDIAQGRDGRVVLWTDEGRILDLSPVRNLPPGELAYAQCAGCHGADLGGSTLGPSLRAIYGRRIATFDGFAYSAALRGVRGEWTRAKLDNFLRNPDAFANGTSMKFAGIASEQERRALLDFLFFNW